ncbi:ABC transporter substrate-binding protein [Orrella sp. 11846]|uniref:ABC transporter substrate-binding protein n=1 Tax=Orrella sp. 11846 TaxID=3409913 RepID=UPI003B5AAC1A
MTIREGVKFHDGTPMTAEDVGLSIMDTLKNPISQMQVYVSGVSGYEVVDDHTLLVNFDVPNPVFPVSLTNVVVMPEKMIEEMGRDKFMTNPIGTGPYKFVKWQTDDYLELTAWEGFWGDQPDFKHVRLQKIPNNSTRVASLISGESQVTEGIAPSDFERIRGDDSLKIEMDPGRRIMYLGLDYHDGVSPGTNVKDKNPFMDPNVRKAISLGIDRELIASKLFDGAVAVSAQFLPPSSAAFNKDVAPIPYDPKQSKELLEKAGYKDGLTVRFDSPNDRYMYDSLVAQAIGGFLKKADVKVDVEAVPMTVYLSSVLRKFNSSMYLLGWGNTASLSTWKSVFHCPDASKGLGVMNFIRYCNPKADAIINEASNTFDSDKRNDLIRQAYAIAIEEDYAYLPLYFQSEVGAMNKHIVWKPRPDGIVLSWEMESKY